MTWNISRVAHRRRVHSNVALLVLLILAGSLAICDVRAQFTANYQTNTVSAVISNWVGDYSVGSNTFADVLIVTNNAVLTNFTGNVGYLADSSNNTAIVTGPGSVWNSGSSLVIGVYGWGNTLTIANSGTVFNANGSIGFQTGANSNAVTVTGAGALWENSGNLCVGYSGSGNQLMIVDGAGVLNNWGSLGSSASSSNNTAIVSGTGSVWSNAGTSRLFVGVAGPGNRLVVSNGGSVVDYMGIFGNAATSSNNTALVSDVGSTWNNSYLYVGGTSSANTLVISNGAQVSAIFSLVGQNANCNGNKVIVTGTGSVWSNMTNCYIGYFGSSNQLVIANGGGVCNTRGFIGYSSSSNVVVVTDAGSVWSNSSYLMMPFLPASDNQLVVTNYGAVVTSNLWVGASSGSNNLVTVAGGVITVTSPGGTGSLVLGGAGQGRLTLNAGTVTADSIVATNGANGAVTLNGGWLESQRTTISNGTEFGVGDGATSATFRLSGGVHSFNDGLRIRNSAILSGCGTINASLVVDVGGAVLAGCGGVLNITGTVTNNGVLLADNDTTINFFGPVINTGQLIATNGHVVFFSTFQDNGLFLTAANSWTNSGAGKWEAAGNWSAGTPNYHQVVNYITNAASKTITLDSTTTNTPGALTIRNLTISAPPGATNTLWLKNPGPTGALTLLAGLTVDTLGAVVVDHATVVTTNADLVVGNTGNGTLLITNGGVALATYSVIGNTIASSNNLAVVANSGSVWSNLMDSYLGDYGSGNQVFVTNGASLISARYSFVGNRSSSSNNVVVVSDPGSLWSSAVLSVGYNGAGNRLILSNGASIFDGTGGAGDGLSSSNNQVVVTGVGSAWVNSNAFTLGGAGPSNRLTITDGGRVAGASGSLGSSNNVAVITGTGSVWSNAAGCYVGFSGAGNQLSILAGGKIVDSTGNIGFNAGSSNNRATVDGAGSVWSNSSSFFVGYSGASNQLTIANGARVFNGFGYIGNQAVSSNNLVVVDGAIWSNANYVYVGHAGAGNRLVISNSAKVFDYLGLFGDSESGSNNTAVVSGVGSLWQHDYTINVGYSSARNQLTLEAGGNISAQQGFIGNNPAASNNLLVIRDATSVWSTFSLYVGYSGGNNQLVITNGGIANTPFGRVGNFSSNNLAIVTGPGSVWSNSSSLGVGSGGASNQLLIAQGAVVTAGTGYLGINTTGNSNLVVVTDTGSVWSNSGLLYVGQSGSGNRLIVTNGGTVVASNVVVSSVISASNNVLRVAGGFLTATAPGGIGGLVVGRGGQGQLILDAGTVTADFVRATNGTRSSIIFNGGWLTTGGTAVTNAQMFVVGSGLESATFHLAGGVHSFANNLRVRSGASLTGCGTINGLVVVDAGGTVLADCGPLVFGQSLTNNGTLRVINGGVLEVYGTVVNNGVLDLINGSTNFHGAFINNGTVLDASSVRISQASQAGENFVVQIPSVVGHTYQLQFTPSLMPTNWTDTGATQPGSGGVLTFSEPGGVTNQPTRFYRARVTAP